MDVAYPFLLKVLDDHKNNLISKEDLYEIFLMVESYVFRRTICEVPTNSLNKVFLSLLNGIDEDSYVESIKGFFNLKEGRQRFPTDSEFKREFCIKNVYNFRNKKYLFEKMENFQTEKEYRYVDDYSIEHIMPQNENLSQQWKKDLGSEWKRIHEEYLHTIGNLTLTGYNSELGNKSFLEKRDMDGGFAHSPISLNSSLSDLESWNEDKIKERADSLAKLSNSIWKFPVMKQSILEKYKKESYDVDDDEPEDQIKWDEKLNKAAINVRDSVNELINTVVENLKCESSTYNDKFALYTQKPLDAKNRFVIITCGKNTAHVSFRIDPDTFQENDKIRKVSGWYFKQGTERRMDISKKEIPQILQNLIHAHHTTQTLSKNRQ